MKNKTCQILKRVLVHFNLGRWNLIHVSGFIGNKKLICCIPLSMSQNVLHGVAYHHVYNLHSHDQSNYRLFLFVCLFTEINRMFALRRQILFCLLIGMLPFGHTWSSFRQQEPLKVCFKNGCVKGTLMDGYQIESFEAFMGIPYAKPPLGNLRFEVSVLWF